MRAKTIPALYRKFEAAVAAMHAVRKHESKFNRAVDRATAIADELIATPAASIDEMLLKIRLAGWRAGIPHKTLDELDRWKFPCTSIGDGGETLVALRKDPRRLKAGKLGLPRAG